MAIRMKPTAFKQLEGDVKKDIKKGTVNAARAMLKDIGVNDPNMSDADVLKSAKIKGFLTESRSQAIEAYKKQSGKQGFDFQRYQS